MRLGSPKTGFNPSGVFVIDRFTDRLIFTEIHYMNPKDQKVIKLLHLRRRAGDFLRQQHKYLTTFTLPLYK